MALIVWSGLLRWILCSCLECGNICCWWLHRQNDAFHQTLTNLGGTTGTANLSDQAFNGGAYIRVWNVVTSAGDSDVTYSSYDSRISLTVEFARRLKVCSCLECGNICCWWLHRQNDAFHQTLTNLGGTTGTAERNRLARAEEKERRN